MRGSSCTVCPSAQNAGQPAATIERPVPLDGPAVGVLALRTGARRVFLTHLLMGFDEAETIAAVRERFVGPVALVQPGDRFTVEG